jgi:glycosyltransferase involved in cell wall biosynthesis
VGWFKNLFAKEQKQSGIVERTFRGTPKYPPVVFRDYGLRRNANVSICVGSLFPAKRIHEAIRFVARFKGEYLFIFGEGPERDQLQALIDEIGCSDRIFLCGAVSKATLALAYNIADICISTSAHEGYGLSLAEAKVCGCTLISYTGDGRDDVGVDISLGSVRENR